MTKVTPTQVMKEATHGIEHPRRADRAKGVTYLEARSYAQRWRDRTDDSAVYLTDIDVPHKQMFIDAGLGALTCFRNEDGNEVCRFCNSPTSPWSLQDHPKYANQGEDYDALLDAVTSDNQATVQIVITGAQRFRIRRAGKLDDLSLLPDDDQIKHPENARLAREIRRRLTATPSDEHHG